MNNEDDQAADKTSRDIDIDNLCDKVQLTFKSMYKKPDEEENNIMSDLRKHVG